MATEVKRRRRRAAPAGIAPSEPERDILDQYLYEVSTHPLLKGNEDAEPSVQVRAFALFFFSRGWEGGTESEQQRRRRRRSQ